MTEQAKVRDWFKYPMKPVRVSESVFARLDLSNYTIERKYDGFRAIVTVSERVSVWTREKRHLPIPADLRIQIGQLGLPEGTVLDGEVWSPDKRGGWKGGEADPCMLAVWDVVRFGFEDMSNRPLEERRAVLSEALKGSGGLVSPVRVEEATIDVLEGIRDEANSIRSRRDARSGYVHGVVVKKTGSPRRDHATRSVTHADWLKIVFTGMEGWEPRQMKSCA